MRHIVEQQKRKNILHDASSASCFMLHASCCGFTIIESLVAVAILLLALTGPMTLAERSLAAADAARRELTVLYLAQEGMEFVRSVRDSNFIQHKGNKDEKDKKDKWLVGLDSCFAVAGCGVDLTETEEAPIIACDEIGNSNCLLTQNISDTAFAKGLFSHKFAGNPQQGWESSGIHRKICIVAVDAAASCVKEDVAKPLANESEVKVNVIMNWDAGSLGKRETIVSSNLSNWYLK